MSDLADLDFHPSQLAHLPIISEYTRRLGILGAVDAALPRDGRNKVSDAECVGLMMLNILSGRVGLYHMGPWLEATDEGVVLGEGCSPGLFSDARLAGALDRIFEYGPDNLLTDVVLSYLRGGESPGEYSVHHDTTTLKLYGEYANVFREGGPVPLNGFSKDHRPDLKQLVYGMSLHGTMGIPLCVSVLDGNASDKEANRLHLDRLAGLLPPEDDVTLVADCKLVDKTTIGRVLDAAFHFVSLLPRSYKLQRQAAEQAAAMPGDLPLLAREKGRNAEEPDRVYRGTSFRAPFTVLDPETGKETTREMRLLAVESPQLARKFEAGLAKRLAKDRGRIERAMKNLEETDFACEEDAEKAFWKFSKAPKLHELTVECAPAVITLPRKRRGRPKKGEPAPTKTVYRLRTKSVEVDHAAVERARVRARFFVLITDHLDTKRWPDTRVLTEYRHQHLIEGHTGFRWLKGPAMVAPLMLNTPARIAALGMVFVLALMVRNYIQAVARANLAKLPGLTFPNMDYKPTRSPTTENVFWLFRNVSSVAISKGGVELDRRISGLDEHCRLAMKLLDLAERAFLERRKRPVAS
ncbi:MAG: IS1634 family transposase [Victivallales bacterium]|nr:IS1634 family transposase [Victivallales bacterium]